MMVAERKLSEIRELAECFHKSLIDEFGLERVCQLIQGGNLFLGTNYARSNNIFVTYNPGKSKEPGFNFNTSFATYNRYWDSYEDKNYPFWTNSRKFFNSQKELRIWINDTTSTFLIPWRTNNIVSLNSDQELKERILEYSGLIFLKMLDHHQARTIIVSGVSTSKLLASKQFLDFSMNLSSVVGKSLDFGPKHRAYQCHIFRPNTHQNLTVFQVPHFSRANSKKLIPKCSSWLWRQICETSIS